MIRLESLRYAYPGSNRPALDGFDLSLDTGERALIVGASGSGKTTVLRAVNGLVPHFYGGRFGGRAVIGGLDTRTASPQTLARHVGTVFQDLPARFLTGTIDDEIGFSLEIGGVERAAARRAVGAIVERMGLTGLAGRRLDHLSAGERARLAIAAAAARRPDVLVLDEPLTHLDPRGAAATSAWVCELSRDDGMTTLIAEHRLEAWDGVDARRIDLDGSWPGPADRIPELAPIAASRLEAYGLEVTFDGRRVLQGVDLEVAPGELVALVGHNGSGKTTLLRTLVGFQSAGAGQVRLDGRAASSGLLAEAGRAVGFVPQEPSALLFADTVESEFASALEAGRDPASAGWLEAFELASLAARNPRDLSAGERQRLALAVVLAQRPSLLLLDEPTLGMDRRRMDWLGGLLRRAAEAGTAVLVATHDTAFVAGFASRAVLLEAGQVRASGPPDQVLSADPDFRAALRRWRPKGGGAGVGRRPAETGRDDADD